MTEMENKFEPKGRTTYYVHGSGLIAVPSERMNEIPRVKSEFHKDEAKRAIILARAWKPA